MSATFFKTHNFTSSDINAVASLHAIGINTGFLTSLGVGFLRLFYRSISKSDAGILIVAMQDEKVCGFVSGTTSIRSVYEYFAKHHFLFLCGVFLKSLFSVKTLKRIFENKRYATQKNPGAKNVPAELLSIVVDERLRGKGVAQGLFAQLTRVFRQKGAERFKIVVGSQLIPAQKFYVKAGAIKTAKLELHKGELSFVYECEA